MKDPTHEYETITPAKARIYLRQPQRPLSKERQDNLIDNLDDDLIDGDIAEAVDEGPEIRTQDLAPDMTESFERGSGGQAARVDEASGIALPAPQEPQPLVPCRGGCGTLVGPGQKCTPCAEAGVAGWKAER